MRWWLIFLRGTKVALASLVVVLVVVMALLKLAAAIPGQAHVFLELASQVAMVGTVVSAGALGLFLWRLRAWERGTAPDCRHCGGPLGSVQDGKVVFGRQLADFRRCYNCDRVTPVVD